MSKSAPDFLMPFARLACLRKSLEVICSVHLATLWLLADRTPTRQLSLSPTGCAKVAAAVHVSYESA